jgi:hypothetical protein
MLVWCFIHISSTLIRVVECNDEKAPIVQLAMRSKGVDVRPVDGRVPGFEAVPLRKDMARFTNLPTSPCTGTATYDHLFLVPMAGRNL